ncbi:atrial natriuretic peptide receptor 1-like [Argopecten irradians]|uniref:atrial natriuretic peptide receptor 1-like n=1 Tax=Argopecten irradians TaxID=31199 RepID=UPI00371ECB29
MVLSIYYHTVRLCFDTTGVVADLYYRNAIDALVGPACPYALDPVARLANYWNIPVITGLGDGGMFKNKTNYPTLTRLAYCQCRLRKVLGSVFEEFQWTDVAIVYDVNDVHSEVLGSTLKVGLQQQNIYPYMFPYYGKDHPDFKAILQEVAMVTRVIVLVAPGESVRTFMLSAFDLGYISNGEFVFFDILLFPFPGEYWGDHDWMRGDTRDSDARKAYEAMFRVSLQVPTSDEWRNFTNEVKWRAKNVYNFSFHGEEVNFFIGAFHDAVLLYGIALNESLTNVSSVRDGYTLTRTMWDRTFQGVTGSVIIDDNGDRDTSYSILDLDPETGEFQVIANFFGDRQWYNPVPAKSVHWSGGRTGPPLNTPVCGFQGNNPECHRNDISSTLVYVIAAISTILVVILAGTIIILRHLKKERELQNMTWMIKYDDINFHADGYSMSVGSMRSYATSSVSLRSSQLNTDLTGTQYLAGFATYRGTPVSVRMVRQKKVDVSRQVLKELQQVRSMTHENLARLVGVGVEPNKVCIVHEFCSKGCIEDILENDNIKMDISFKISILKDIAAGMSFIQSSCLRYHGYLTSKCCMVDSRFVVKISDYGLPTLYRNARISHYGQELWVAPEHLRGGGHSAKGDVFSFAIIIVEVLSRANPYDAYRTVMDVQEIVDMIKARDEPLFRPIVPKDRGPPVLIDLLERCWAEVPEDRPDFHSITRSLRKIMGAKHTNFVDMLLQRMEKYATNLEDIVEERTKQLLLEKKRSEELLHQILPRSVARDLIQGRQVLPESFSSVSIYFSDLVDFTSLCSKLTALQVIDVLNEVYTLFDNIIDKYNVYKVETIGDAYMVASGLPIRNGSQHVSEICRMALDLLGQISTHQLNNVVDKVKLRIGIHTGPCVTGVVGLKMPRYCLFGDTVNTASRMESTGAPSKIHISDVTKKAVDSTGMFTVECRGEISIKGKGIMTTYWLLEEASNSTC